MGRWRTPPDSPAQPEQFGGGIWVENWGPSSLGRALCPKAVRALERLIRGSLCVLEELCSGSGSQGKVRKEVKA